MLHAVVRDVLHPLPQVSYLDPDVHVRVQVTNLGEGMQIVSNHSMQLDKVAFMKLIVWKHRGPTSK